jgi:hypothetical protein
VIKNVALNSYGYGSAFKIEKKVNNNWIPVPVVGSHAWTDEMRILKGKNTNEEEINWALLYGELNPGNYRVTKNFAYITRAGNGEYYPISVEFTIN